MRSRGPVRLAAAALAGAAALVSCDPLEARPGRASRLTYDALPPWIREAAARNADSVGAAAVRLHDEVIVEPLAAGGVRITRRMAGKVLEPEALRDLGSLSLFYRREDRIVSQEAWNLLPDGTVRIAHSKDDLVDGPAIHGYSIFEDSRASTITPPGVRVGSVVAFEDVLDQDFDGGAQSFYFGDAEHPTAFSRFVLRVPEGWSWRAVPIRTEDLGIERVETPGGVSLTVRDIEPYSREPLDPPLRDVVPVAWYRWWSPDGRRGFSDWDAVARWYETLTAHVLDDPGESSQIARRMRPAGKEELLDRIADAYSFVAQQVRYVSIQIGIGGYRPASPAEVCALRYGDCKAKTFLIRSLVDSWGLDNYAVLVRTKDRGRLSQDVPSPRQFNHVIAAVRLPEDVGDGVWSSLDVEGIGRLLFLDATASNASARDLREDVQGTTALLVTRDGGTLVTLPVQTPGSARTTRVLDASIDDQGSMTEATLIETWTGTAAASVRGYYGGMSDEDRRRAVAEDVQDRFPASEVSEYSIDGLERNDAPVIETTRLVGGRLGKRLSELLIVEPGGCAYGLLRQKLPDPPRSLVLEVGQPREEAVEVSVRTPAGWIPEELPEPFRLESSGLRASGRWEFEEGRLVYNRTATLREPRIAPDRYPEFRDALSRLQHEDSRAVVFVPRTD